jgi:hypothetical protein
VTFAVRVKSPFAEEIQGINLPEHWSRGIDTDVDVTPQVSDMGLGFTVEGKMFAYERSGLRRVRE